MLSSVSSGLPPTPPAPSGDAMAGGRDEPVGHGDLQKGGMPQLSPHPQICGLNILWLGNGKLRQGQHCALLWQARLTWPHGTPQAPCTPKRDPLLCVCLSCLQAVLHKVRNWMDTGGGGKACGA